MRGRQIGIKLTDSHNLKQYENIYDILIKNFFNTGFFNKVILYFKLFKYKSIDDNIVLTSKSNLKGLLRITSKFIKKGG